MKKQKIQKILIVILFLIFLYLFDFLCCPFYEFTNLYCPGCGITRMIISILTFDFYQAFRFNPFLFILFPFFLLCFIDEMIILIFDSDGKFTKKIPDKIYYCLLILTLIFGVLRNIPFFDYLIPTYI